MACTAVYVRSEASVIHSMHFLASIALAAPDFRRADNKPFRATCI